jgi:PKD repeat protein
MTITRHEASLGARSIALAGVVALLWGGCSLDKKEIPALVGPAETAISVNLTAQPDVIVADGHSSVSAQATLRNTAGQPIAGQAIFFALTNQDGLFADIGTLNTTTAVTNGNGIAQVIYTSPQRSDFTANQRVMIAARPITGDALGQFYRTVSIELRSAEPRLFPQVPGNKAPICNFVMEPATGLVPVNTDLLAQSTSSDPDGIIVRYEWDFGDGAVSDHPDVVHRYGFSGLYTLTHVVTDNGGIQAACAAGVFVQ